MNKEPNDLRPHYTTTAVVGIAILSLLLAIGIWLFLTNTSFNGQMIAPPENDVVPADPTPTISL